MFFYWPSVLFQFTLFLNDNKSNFDSATSKPSDKNAKLREGSKITIEYNPKCSSSNDPEEKNTSEDNPNSKLTSTGSRSDYSSCDAKKRQDSKIATDLDCGDSRADSLNAKLREGSKNTSSSNDPEEKNTSEDNPNSKLLTFPSFNGRLYTLIQVPLSSNYYRLGV